MISTLQLDPTEKQLKHLLLDVASYIDKTRAAKKISEPVVLRWAGGWVRDKLLGKPSHDIDVAVNCMTGEDFGCMLRAFSNTHDNVTKHNLRPGDIGNLHKIAMNPAKSKNLETITVRLFGLDVDLVNLRTEIYNEDSRNPLVQFGTAEMDAKRRDATVNALFYNLHTGEIEDFVGGLKDLEAKIIRTPTDPFQTFMDDPLRVLRLVRFASRLGFEIDPDTRRRMSNASVLGALRVKISRERVGVEIRKMLQGDHPWDGVRLIDQLNLYHAIFTDPATPAMAPPSLTGWSTVYNFLHRSASDPAASLYNKLVTSDEARYHMWILACLVPFAQIPSDPTADTKKQPPPATAVARQGLKAPNRLTNVITAAVCNRAEICDLKEEFCRKSGCMIERDRLGLAIRRWEGMGKNWRLQVMFALLFDLLVQAQRLAAEDKLAGSDPILPPTPASVGGTIEDVEAGWKRFLDHIEQLDLMDAPSIKPLVDGRKLLEALGIQNFGKWTTVCLNICLAWQLRHPDETHPAGAFDEIRQRKEELGIPL